MPIIKRWLKNRQYSIKNDGQGTHMKNTSISNTYSITYYSTRACYTKYIIHLLIWFKAIVLCLTTCFESITRHEVTSFVPYVWQLDSNRRPYWFYDVVSGIWWKHYIFQCRLAHPVFILIFKRSMPRWEYVDISCRVAFTTYVGRRQNSC